MRGSDPSGIREAYLLNSSTAPGQDKFTAFAATGRNGISHVDLLINGKLAAKDTTKSYTFTINTKKHGKKIKIQIRVYDRAGNVTTTTTRAWRR